MRQLNEAGVKWVSRVWETSTEAKTVLDDGSETWQSSEDGTLQWFSRRMSLPQGEERWVVVRTLASQQRARASLQRQVSQAQGKWEQKCWHLGKRRFVCQADARLVLERELKGKLSWLEIHEETARKACWIIGTNVLEMTVLWEQQLVTMYKEQGGVGRGFRFLKDPLFLASSVFVKKPERLIALSLIMVLCLLVYRLADWLKLRRVDSGKTGRERKQISCPPACCRLDEEPSDERESTGCGSRRQIFR
jgi:transposase